MRCDVCDTKIPFGKNECPNCGMKIKDHYVNAFDASGHHHNHIQVNKVQPNNQKNEDNVKKLVNDYSSHKPKVTTQSVYKSKTVKDTNKGSKVIFISIFLIVLSMFLGSCGAIVSEIFETFPSDFETFFSETLEYLGDDYYDLDDFIDVTGYDLQSVVDMRDDYYNKFNQYFEDVEIEEYIEEDEDVYTNIYIYGYKDDVEYGVDLNFVGNDLREQGIIVCYNSEYSLEKYNSMQDIDYKSIQFISESLDMDVNMKEVAQALKDDFSHTSSHIEYNGYNVYYDEYENDLDYTCYINIYK